MDLVSALAQSTRQLSQAIGGIQAGNASESIQDVLRRMLEPNACVPVGDGIRALTALGLTLKFTTFGGTGNA
jgi:hypothetical protein